jgi:hypothetical protein
LLSDMSSQNADKMRFTLGIVALALIGIEFLPCLVKQAHAFVKDKPWRAQTHYSVASIGGVGY